MPTELVLLCDADPSAEVIDGVGRELFPGGDLVDYGATSPSQWVDSDGRAVLSVFPGKAIIVRDHADRVVEGGTGKYSRWVDLTIPYGEDAKGRHMARALALAVDGTITTRN